MTYSLEFEKLITYDSGKSGITITIELSLSDKAESIEAKIDTGSTYCVFNKRYGEKLGIEIDKGLPEIISTANSLFKAFGHQMTLRFENYEFDSTIYFAEDESFNRNVLGRHGFLDRVVIGINDYDGKLYLSRYGGE